MAYELGKKGKKCLVIDRRDHIAGNIYCEEIEGIHVHKYGAHIFHTSDKKIWEYMNQFTEFNNYINSPVAVYKDELYNLPFNMNTFSKMWGIKTPQEAKDIIAKQIKELENIDIIYMVRECGLTPEALTEAYREMLRTANMELIVLGCTAEQTAAVKDALLAELAALDRAPLPLAENIAMPRREPVHKTETYDMVQAKLCMLFTLGEPMRTEQLAAVRLAMALYGGSVTSRLFLNVRERDHLCYYCSSSFQSFTGSMAVNSGVEHADAARAEQAILKELADLCDGPITDDEFEDCRRGLLSGMQGVEDTLGGIETWYYIEVLRGGDPAKVQTPAEARAALQAVTKDDVRAILRKLTLSVSYLLTKEVAAHAAE